MPARRLDSVPAPVQSSTFTDTTDASLATPWPAEAAIPATTVPWPSQSPVVASTKLAGCSARPPKSGWRVSTPVSSTNTVTPRPVAPGGVAPVEGQGALVDAVEAPVGRVVLRALRDGRGVDRHRPVRLDAQHARVGPHPPQLVGRERLGEAHERARVRLHRPGADVVRHARR